MISEERRLDSKVAKVQFPWHELCVPTLLVGVVWPGIVVGIVLYFAILYGSTTWLTNPLLLGLPSPLSYVEIFLWSGAVCPLFNFIGCQSVLTRATTVSNIAAACNGFALMGGLVWSLSAAVALYSLGLHPFIGDWVVYSVLLAPIASLVGSLVLASAISARAEKSQYWKVQGLSALGLSLGFTLLVGPHANYFAQGSMVQSAKWAPSNNDRRSAVRLLRTFGNLNDVLSGCYGVFGEGLPYQVYSSSLSKADYRDVYYRVTGQSFNEVAPPSEYTRRFRFDADLAGDLVGGTTGGVVVDSSAIRGEVDEQAKVAYLEWGMQFSNTTETAKEARAQIKLPAGSVVSRAVLWMNGVQKEATFADRTRARDAYRSAVVVQRRDPLLVSYHGADRLMVQCFPVPVKASHSNIKILIGIAVPLSRVDANGKFVMTLPKIVDANFKQSAPSLNLESAYGKGFMSRDASLIGNRMAPPLQKKSTQKFFVVIDGGKELAKHRQELAKAVSSLAAFGETQVFFASDELTGIADSADGGTPAAVAAYQFGMLPFVGGPDNGAAIERAVRLGRQVANSTVIWLHGPQPQKKLDLHLAGRQRVERFDVRFVDIDVQPGPMNCAESLKVLSPMSWDRTEGPLSDDVSALAKSIELASSGGRGQAPPLPGPSMVPIGGRPAHSVQTTSTLALAARRLSDKKLVDALLQKNMAQNASELAQSVGIVSPVTSAVVLENDSQYFNFGIEPRAHRESRESLLAQSSAGADSSGASLPSLNFARSEIVNQLNSLNTYTPAASTQLQGSPTSATTNSPTIGTQEAERQRSQGNPLLPFQITLAILFLIGLCISIKLKLRASCANQTPQF